MGRRPDDNVWCLDLAHVGALAALPRRVRFVSADHRDDERRLSVRRRGRKKHRRVAEVGHTGSDRTMLFAAELETAVSRLSE